MKNGEDMENADRKTGETSSESREDLAEASSPTDRPAGAEGKPAEAGDDRTTSTRKEDEMSEEELRRLVEESLEKVSVADMVLVMMNQLASVGYLKMGLPEQANRKYRDLEQAILAIDALEAMIKGVEGKIPEEKLRPFRGTLANLQLNYVQQRKGGA